MFRNIKLFLILAIYLIRSQKLMKRISNMSDIEERAQAIAVEGEEWGQMLLRNVHGEITVVGAEKIDPNKTVCFISNHQSYFDIPIFLGYIPMKKAFLAKVEILKVPILSKWMHLMRCVFIDRKNIRQSVTAIKEATQILKDGLSMVVFPEGTRAKDGVIGEFKSGGFKMAVSSGVPIVPVTIDGAFRFFDKSEKIKGPVKVSLIVDDMVETTGLSKEEVSELPDKIRSIIARNLEGK